MNKVIVVPDIDGKLRISCGGEIVELIIASPEGKQIGWSGDSFTPSTPFLMTDVFSTARTFLRLSGGVAGLTTFDEAVASGFRTLIDDPLTENPQGVEYSQVTTVDFHSMAKLSRGMSELGSVVIRFQGIGEP
ncbi:hypothetical protein [Rhizorhabdus dicambivorans]|uniref:Uncharacterized protein n=1 Tax=Rhizorhabdus dicambivorans TaxID=1850238 RepID=A0A2A4FUC9_9SPHN|nr:hypothetical protein [Rhizorhabdus dicambivorans]ATE66460.1 hypothetical protein CMV14_20305 [Rhizorhabdus dicambivorans]PCE41048.1 hypothetical protein COO09_17015 [Rhizorhabdus dicambivorans]